MKTVLVVSLTKFYGGGESFILSHFTDIEGIDFLYLIASEQLKKQLPMGKTFFITDTKLRSAAKYIKNIIKEKSIDVVILNGGRSLFLSSFIHRHSKCVGIRHTLNAYVNTFAIYRDIYIGVLNMCYCFMKSVVHVSQKSKAEQIFARKKGVVIYNGVLEKQELSPKNGKNFIFIGRLSREKGVHILISAFNAICKADKNVHLYLVGTGEIDTSFPHDENIHFEGFSTELEKFYRMANWYISLTSRENCSISVLDALSYGIPVITTDVGGNPELIQNKFNGFIISPSENAVKTLFFEILNNMADDQYQELSQNAYKTFSEKFNLRKQKVAYKELLENI